MGGIVLAILMVGYAGGAIIGFGLGLKTMVWVLQTRAKQHGMSLDLAKILQKPAMTRESAAAFGGSLMGNTCANSKAPSGWYCSRSKGHDGPCATYQGPERAICPIHQTRMSLSFSDRPGSAPGNGRFCRECAADYHAVRNTQAR